MYSWSRSKYQKQSKPQNLNKVNAIYQDGAVALHVAAQEGHFEIVCLLLDSGADPFLQTVDSRTALNIAVLKEHQNIVQKLATTMQAPHQQPVQRRSLPQMHPFPAQAHFLKSEVPSGPKIVPIVPDDMLCCPITLDIMKDPVVAGDGHTYERNAITAWIRRHGISPITQAPISLRSLVPNLAIKYQIELYLREQAKS